jgi:uncharacterized membrane protein YphA (DoxX/SURF4 family)
LLRGLIGLVLLVSGTLKLRQPAWPAAAAAFGTPRLVIPLVPWVEIVLGALLVAQVGGPWTPLGALALLAAFTVAVAWHLLRGDRVPCACFGERSSKPVDAVTLSRNLALCALALAAVAASR